MIKINPFRAYQSSAQQYRKTGVLYCLVLLAIAWFASASASEPIVAEVVLADIIMDDQSQHIQIAPEQLHACSTLMSIDQENPFLVKPCELNQTPTQRHHSASPKTLWLSFSLRNTTNHDAEYWLTLGDPLIEQIRIWQSNLQKVQKRGSLSSEQPTSTSQFLVPIFLPAQAQITLMIGYASSTPINTRLDLWQPQAYLNEQLQTNSLMSLALGGLLLAFLLTLLTYLWLKDSLYLWFIATLASEAMLLVAQTSTQLSRYLASNLPSALPFYTYLIALVALLNLIFYARFLYRLRQQQKQASLKSKHYQNAFAGLLGLFFILAFIESLSLFTDSLPIQLPTMLGTGLILLSTPLILISIMLKNQQLELEVQQRTQENKAKARFLREVNHEIRAPLNRVLTQALEIERPLLREKIIQNCRHVILTIDEALSYNSNALRPIAKIDQTVLTWRAFTDLLSQSGREIVERTYQEHGNQFNFDCQISPYPWIMIDERRFMQIIDNLITNAARYTRHGHIHLRVTLAQASQDKHTSLSSASFPLPNGHQEVCFHIQDTGVGISQEDQLRIFEPFVRGSAGLTSGCNGVGMGLAIVKQLTEQLQGTIKLNSQEGRGTEFTLTLPIYPATETLYSTYQETHNTDLKHPDEQKMKHLNELIQQGGISDIIRWANQLSTQYPEYTKFCKEIIESAVKGDMSRLRQLARHKDDIAQRA